ncbi:YitT family protein [Fictibacillus enclensis]|uniref:YitT family protein n=1 Tax=Fictibacillus enclensis TaxID=1017270 RepID=UPI0025A1E67E|nr:YitT family protein [Fictibacillus enclensis]MDM5199501.1 YitT family protein [Fictibacillus enclensis]MDM5338738.1 YitT family protein [Fictibacillus enclensis]
MTFPIRTKNVFFILLGSAIFSFGIVHFNMQNNLAEGGFTGITLILYFLFHIDPSYSNLALNLPLFFVGWKLLGKNAFIYTLIGTLGVSLFLYLFQRFSSLRVDLKHDMPLAALFAGVFIGIGLGIIFRYGGTTGGVDIIARLGHKFMGWSMGKTMFMFDFVVISISLVYLDYKEAMYTLVAVFVGARVIDFMQEGAYAGKAAMIISEKNTEIAALIMKEMDRGATLLTAKGSFTGTQKEVLYCVFARNEIVRLKQVIERVDPHAFVTVNDVHEVLGEGFTLDADKNPIGL